MFRNRPVSLALVGLFVWVTGCHSYKQISIGELRDHTTVRVTLTNGEREEVYYPGVVAGLIRGETDDGFVAFFPESVAKIEAVGTDEVGTVFVALGVAVLALGVVVAIACAIEPCQLTGYGTGSPSDPYPGYGTGSPFNPYP